MNELIDAFRYCADYGSYKKGCSKCPINANGMVCGTHEDAIAKAADAIERLVSGLQWISVKDELPNDSRTVIIYSRSGIVGCGFYMGSRNNWLHLTTTSGGVLADDVTHWMELPQSPKGFYPEWRTMCFNRRYNDDV